MYKIDTNAKPGTAHAEYYNRSIGSLLNGVFSAPVRTADEFEQVRQEAARLLVRIGANKHDIAQALLVPVNEIDTGDVKLDELEVDAQGFYADPEKPIRTRIFAGGYVSAPRPGARGAPEGCGLFWYTPNPDVGNPLAAMFGGATGFLQERTVIFKADVSADLATLLDNGAGIKELSAWVDEHRDLVIQDNGDEERNLGGLAGAMKALEEAEQDWEDDDDDTGEDSVTDEVGAPFDEDLSKQT